MAGSGGGQGHFQGARADPSLAALMGGDGRYVLNGNWAVSPAGTYEAAGTRVIYTRATGPEETLRAAGPTSEDLLLQVGVGLRGRLGVGGGVKESRGEQGSEAEGWGLPVRKRRLGRVCVGSWPASGPSAVLQCVTLSPPRPRPRSSCRSPTQALNSSSGSLGSATAPSRRRLRSWAGPRGSLSLGR